MKQSFHFHGLLFLLLILFSFSTFSTTSGRLLLPKQVEKEVNFNGSPQNSPILELEEKDAWELMGVEDCQSTGDEEECFKRRMISEVHLDYIYTQHHKP
ncbi:Phytosulfokine [Macleaya cordata]|uniref:Phytosulfokine n=1 Tax=Macleaya cordata TaxID=56857 RepID=A0A200Q2F7_MACCD|nr:Phytosulfokine [Macleaya cordata]